MRYFISLVMVLCLISCKQHQIVNDKPKPIISLDFQGFSTYLNKQNDTTYIVNFWATWCAPCVKELPYFENLNTKDFDKPVKVLLVSLDMPSQFDSRLKPFVKDKNLLSQVILLDDLNQNEWIPKVNSTWDGAIPATLIYNKNERQFFAKSFTEEELNSTIKLFMQ